MALGDGARPRLSAVSTTSRSCAALLDLVDDVVLPGWRFADLETAADEVRAEAAEAGRDPASLGVAALVTVSIGRTEAEARARADADEVFAQLGHPAESGIFGTLEECQDRVIALAHAGISDLRCLLPASLDVHDVIAQLTAVTVGTTDVLAAGRAALAGPATTGGLGRPGGRAAQHRRQRRIQAALMRRAVSTTSGRKSVRSATGSTRPAWAQTLSDAETRPFGVDDGSGHRAQPGFQLLVDDGPALAPHVGEDVPQAGFLDHRLVRVARQAAASQERLELGLGQVGQQHPSLRGGVRRQARTDGDGQGHQAPRLDACDVQDLGAVEHRHGGRFAGPLGERLQVGPRKVPRRRHPTRNGLARSVTAGVSEKARRSLRT